MTTLYELDRHSIWTGRTDILDPQRGRPRNWTPIAPPEVPEGQMAQLRGRVWVLISEIPESDLARELRDAQARAIQRINAAYTEAVRPLLRDYPDPEPLSWPQQDAESRAYIDWHEAGATGTPPATPRLDAILAGRNGTDGTETLLELCQAVQRNAQAFTQAMELTGRRQRLVKQAQAAQTIAEAEAVEWTNG